MRRSLSQPSSPPQRTSSSPLHLPLLTPAPSSPHTSLARRSLSDLSVRTELRDGLDIRASPPRVPSRNLVREDTPFVRSISEAKSTSAKSYRTVRLVPLLWVFATLKYVPKMFMLNQKLKYKIVSSYAVFAPFQLLLWYDTATVIDLKVVSYCGNVLDNFFTYIICFFWGVDIALSLFFFRFGKGPDHKLRTEALVSGKEFWMLLPKEVMKFTRMVWWVLLNIQGKYLSEAATIQLNAHWFPYEIFTSLFISICISHFCSTIS